MPRSGPASPLTVKVLAMTSSNRGTKHIWGTALAETKHLKRFPCRDVDVADHIWTFATTVNTNLYLSSDGNSHIEDAMSSTLSRRGMALPVNASCARVNKANSCLWQRMAKTEPPVEQVTPSVIALTPRPEPIFSWQRDTATVVNSSDMAPCVQSSGQMNSLGEGPVHTNSAHQEAHAQAA